MVLNLKPVVGMMPKMNAIMTILLSAVVASVFLWLLRPLIERVSVSARKKTVTLGGLFFFLALLFSAYSLPFSLVPYRGMFAGCVLLVVLGVLRDYRMVSEKYRVFAQVLAIILMIAWSHVTVNSFGNLFYMGDIKLGIWAFPVTLVLVLAYMQSFQVLRVREPLAIGVYLIQAGMLLFLSIYLGRSHDMHCLLIISAVLLVMLAHQLINRRKGAATLQLGHSGFDVVAYLLAAFAITITQLNVDVITPMALFWIFIYPLFDLIGVSIIRLKERRSLLQNQKDHCIALLKKSGHSDLFIHLLLLTFTFLGGLIGIVCFYLEVDEALQWMLWMCLLIIYLLWFICCRHHMAKE